MKKILILISLCISQFSYSAGSHVASDYFSLLLWNIKKGARKHWASDFKAIARNKDMIIIQEALMTDKVKNAINLDDYEWQLAKSFRYFGNDTGVLTISNTHPKKSKVILSKPKEPITGTSKATLISLFSIENSSQTLMIVNSHGINFVGKKKFTQQMKRIEKYMAKHNGPLVWAGDLNTWSKKRLQIVLEIAKNCNLIAVNFPKGSIKTGPIPWEKSPLDHLFYRGLNLIDSEVLEDISSSDHKPIQATFEFI